MKCLHLHLLYSYCDMVQRVQVQSWCYRPGFSLVWCAKHRSRSKINAVVSDALMGRDLKFENVYIDEWALSTELQYSRSVFVSGFSLHAFAFVEYVISSRKQGIINWTGTETFAKEPNLAKLLRGLKLTPPRCTIKKVPWFLSYVCNGKRGVFS